MKKLLFIIIFLSLTATSYAIGLGIHLTGGYTTHTGYNETRLGQKFFTGLGFVLDTTVAADNLFNYRMQLGYTNTGTYLFRQKKRGCDQPPEFIWIRHSPASKFQIVARPACSSVF